MKFQLKSIIDSQRVVAAARSEWRESAKRQGEEIAKKAH